MTRKRPQSYNEDTDGQWQMARRHVSALGPMSNFFSHCVRALKNDIAQSNRERPEVSGATRQQLERVFNSPTLKAVLYYAARTFCDEKLKKVKCLTVPRLIDIFGPEPLSSILAVAYLYRRARKISDADKFERIVNTVQNSVDLGGHLGAAIPDIGLAHGILLGGMRQIALTLFLKDHADQFRDYRLHLKLKNLPYDLEMERRSWGCTHIQVASVMLQGFGFGVEEARAFTEGISDTDFSKLSPLARRFKVASVWLDALLTTGEPPKSEIGDEYPISDQALTRLEHQIRRILTDGSELQWLSRSAQDISPELTPQLFHQADLVMLQVQKNAEQEKQETDNFDFAG